MMLAGMLPSATRCETYAELPPPPGRQPVLNQQTIMLALFINQMDSGQLIPVEIDDEHYWIQGRDLRQAGIEKAPFGNERIEIGACPGASATIDHRLQRLMLDIPPAWLPDQAISAFNNPTRVPAQVSPGILLNYDLYLNRVNHHNERLNTWSEIRYFGPGGALSTDGIIRTGSGARGANSDAYLRYDTYWTNEDEDHSVSWTIGDQVTPSLAWSNSVRIGGIGIGKDFSIRPDIITYPLPSFSGESAVPSTLDLFINGYRTGGAQLQAGPYSLTNIPFVNGAGNAVVVTHDALGRQLVTTLPFYVSSDLLTPGLDDYSFSTGVLRKDYGVKSFTYRQWVATGSYRRGITEWLTLEALGEGAESLGLAGIGSLVRLGQFGVVNGAWSHSRVATKPGDQFDWGYQYKKQKYNFGMRHTTRSERFGDLALYSSELHRHARLSASSSLSRRSTQYYSGIALQHYGSLGAALIDIHSANGEQTRLWNLSWSKNIWNDISLMLTGSYDQQRCEGSLGLLMVIPFSYLNSGSLGLERNKTSGFTQRAVLSRAIQADGGLGGEISWARESKQDHYRQATLRWLTSDFDTSAGFYGNRENLTQWADFTGAVVVMDGRLVTADPLHNAFVLVKTGYPGVTVHYENQPAGLTDARGYLLVPDISAWYPAKYSIDTLALPMDLMAKDVEQQVAVRRRSGYLLHFPIEQVKAVHLQLIDQRGEPLPVGSRVIRPGSQLDYVGWDGMVWLQNPDRENRLQVMTADGRRCEVNFTLPEQGSKPLTPYGPLSCSLEGAIAGEIHDSSDS